MIGCVMANTMYRNKDDECEGRIEACLRCQKPVCAKHNKQSTSRCRVPSVCLQQG
jgi:hypothetical protein